MPFLFEKLVVYQRSVAVAGAIATLTESFPSQQRFLVDQLLRASASISLNIAEGNGRLAHGDRAQFFSIARGSSYECIPLLELAQQRGLVSSARRLELYRELDEICRMLNGLIRPKKKTTEPPGQRATSARTQDRGP